MGHVLAGARVVTPEGVLESGWVVVEGATITSVGRGVPPVGSLTDLGGAWLVPGFVDVHMHGGGGHDVAASAASLNQAVAFHHAHGTTTTLASLVTAAEPDLVDQLRWIAAETRRAAANNEPGNRLVGAHLEGPFLAPSRCGAQNVEHMKHPDPGLLQRLQSAAAGTLRVVTIAPELPGALEVIRAVVAGGAIAAIGHTDATYDQARAGFDAGAVLATHLFNGMRPRHHREPGAAGAALGVGAFCEIICDGRHVHPAMIREVAAGRAELILITDAIAAAGVSAGDFRLGGQDVSVVGGTARLRSTGSLAGSTLTMAAALRRAVVEVGLPIQTAVRAAATAPATLLGLAGDRGAIAPGLRADLVVLDDELRVSSVISGGVATRSG